MKVINIFILFIIVFFFSIINSAKDQFYINQQCKQVCKKVFSLQELKTQQQLYDNNYKNLGQTYKTDTQYVINYLFQNNYGTGKPIRNLLSSVKDQIIDNIISKFMGMIVLGLIILYYIFSLFKFKIQQNFKLKYIQSLSPARKHKIAKIFMIIILAIVILIFLMFLQAARQNNFHKKSLNTFICNLSIIDWQKYADQIQKHIQQLHSPYKSIQPLIKNQQGIKNMMAYGDDLVKKVSQQKLYKNKDNGPKLLIIKQLITLNKTLVNIQRFNSSYLFYNQTIQFFRENLILARMIKSMIIRYAHKYMKLENVSYYFFIISDILDYLFIIGLGYIIYVVSMSFGTNKVKFYKKWTHIPNIIFFIIVLCIIFGLIGSIASPVFLYIIRGYEGSGRNLQSARNNFELPDKYRWNRFQSAAIMIAPQAKFQDIKLNLNHQGNQLFDVTQQLLNSLKYFQNKGYTFYESLYKNTQNLITKRQKDFEQWEDSQVHKFLRDNLFQETSTAQHALQQIISKQLLSNPKVDLQQFHKETTSAVYSLYKVLLNVSQFNRKLYIKTGYLLLLTLLCLTISRSFIKYLNLRIHSKIIPQNQLKYPIQLDNMDQSSKSQIKSLNQPQ